MTTANVSAAPAPLLEQPQETAPVATSAKKTGPRRYAISLGDRLIYLGAIIVPFIGLGLAIGLLWGVGFSWVHLWLLLGMYVVSAFGVTVGYHRLFTHRSFTTNRTVKTILAILGSMATEGPLLKWVAQHRMHHQMSDAPGDPHSPHEFGGGFVGTLRGLWHAHVGWIFGGDDGNLDRYVSDLSGDGVLRAVSKLFPLWVALGMFIPALLGGLITRSWTGALLGFIWGGLARVFFVHHITWSINSVCHFWGTRPYECHDESRNNFVFGVLGFGEGWHNNHHAFPTSARHGLKWWQLDASYWLIRGMELVGLADKVKVPPKSALLLKAR